MHNLELHLNFFLYMYFTLFLLVKIHLVCLYILFLSSLPNKIKAYGRLSNSRSYFLFLQSDADYWLLTDDDVSITDLWRRARILFFNVFMRSCLYIIC
jgi:hypothetical protein